MAQISQEQAESLGRRAARITPNGWEGTESAGEPR